MTTKDKAKELTGQFIFKIEDFQNGTFEEDNDKAKICALICVDEILSLFEQNKFDSRYEYYLVVKQEIEKL